MSNEISQARDDAADAASAERCFNQLHLRLLADLAYRGDVATVGDEGVDLRQMADAHRGCALELGLVGDQDDVPCIGDDRLRHLDLTEIEVEQGAVMR